MPTAARTRKGTTKRTAGATGTRRKTAKTSKRVSAGSRTRSAVGRKKTTARRKTTSKVAKRTTSRTAKRSTSSSTAKRTRSSTAKKSSLSATSRRTSGTTVRRKTTTARSKRRTPNAAFMAPLQPDHVLSAVVGSRPLPRTQVTKKLWNYIKKNGLQDATKRTMINADANLRPVFGGKRKIDMFQMTKLVSKHLVKID